MMAIFRDLDLAGIRNSTVFLDVDGTLVADGEERPAEAERAQVAKLVAQGNRALILSNKPLKERNEGIARDAGIKCVRSRYKKPDKRIIGDVERYEKGEAYVIGDKFMTDGLFARNVGARFIKVDRKISGKESFKVRFVNFIDGIVYRVYLMLTGPWTT